MGEEGKNAHLKLIKIRFTSWRDHDATPRTISFQAQLDALTMREGALIAASARVRDEQGHDSEALQRSLARINADLETIDAERTFLLSGEEATAEARAASNHERVGTFGYQVLSGPDDRVAMVVDEAGKYLPAQAAFSYEVVDDNPPLPTWAKEGKSGL